MPKIPNTIQLKNGFRHLHPKGMPYPIDSYSTKLLMYQEEAPKSTKSRHTSHYKDPSHSIIITYEQ